MRFFRWLVRPITDALLIIRSAELAPLDHDDEPIALWPNDMLAPGGSEPSSLWSYRNHPAVRHAEIRALNEWYAAPAYTGDDR